ncbi:MAG: glycosyltransferase family 4 protein [Pyrinomonadaceae bacterium]
MRVLALCSYPVEAAATRFRLAQFVGPLRERGIELTISPFLSSEQFASLYHGGGIAAKALGMIGPLARRIGEIASLGKYDLLLVQREAMLFGPAIFEPLFARLGRLPMVLDLDDATYVHYVSPTYGRIGSALKFFGKTDALIRRSQLVICGNRFIAEHVDSLGGRSAVIPTVVDLDEFCPRKTHNDPPVIGWIGTHSTYEFVESLFPVFERLAARNSFRLKLVGGGRASVTIPGVEVECLDWDLQREVSDFRSLDIGVYPITVSSSANEEWIRGKSGFKAIQYMAVGVPFVMSPVGVCAEMGEPGVTHFNASTSEDWYTALNTLLTDRERRFQMGMAGRQFALGSFDLGVQAERLAEALQRVVKEG